MTLPPSTPSLLLAASLPLLLGLFAAMGAVLGATAQTLWPLSAEQLGTLLLMAFVAAVGTAASVSVGMVWGALSSTTQVQP